MLTDCQLSPSKDARGWVPISQAEDEAASAAGIGSLFVPGWVYLLVVGWCRMGLRRFSGVVFFVVLTAIPVFLGCAGDSHFVGVPTTGPVEIIAHRGASFVAPENTLAAVSMAWARGSDAVEVDVHLSRDGRIVAIHDRSTARTSGRHLRIARTDSATLRQLDVGRRKSPAFAGQRIPSLEEILAVLPSGRRLFVEVKCGDEIVPVLSQVLNNSGKRSQVAIIGFSLRTMKACKAALADVPVYWLCDATPFTPCGKRLITKVVANGLDGLSVHHSGVWPGFVRTAQASGLDLYVWTVDDARRAARLSAWGVDGITTNRPGRVRQRAGSAVARR